MSSPVVTRILDRLPHPWTSEYTHWDSRLPLLVLATIVAGAIIYGIYEIFQIGKRPKDIPPGPPTVPILGNIHLVDSRMAFVLRLLSDP